MSDFKDHGPIDIQPFDRRSYEFIVNSHSEPNMGTDENPNKPDGQLPYGVLPASVEVFAYNEQTKENVTTQMIFGASTLVGIIITVSLKWPETSGAGTYKLTFEIVGDNSDQFELDFDPVYVKDKRR